MINQHDWGFLLKLKERNSSAGAFSNLDLFLKLKLKVAPRTLLTDRPTKEWEAVQGYVIMERTIKPGLSHYDSVCHRVTTMPALLDVLSDEMALALSKAVAVASKK